MTTTQMIRSFDGTQLYSSTLGKGPPIVLCDGLGCEGFIWRYLRPFLARQHTVIHWHYRGHGRSQAPIDQDCVGVPAFCADLEAICTAYQLEQPVLMGHSLGVQVILQYGLTHPEKIAALVPMCGSYGRPLDTLHGDGRASVVLYTLSDWVQRFPSLGQMGWRMLMRSALPRVYTEWFEVNRTLLDQNDLTRYFEHLATIDVQLFFRILHRMQEHSVEDKLHLLHVPALVVAGERDLFTPAWLSHRMQLLIPGAELLVVPGGTHVAPLEIPELITLRVERFLQARVAHGANNSLSANSPSHSNITSNGHVAAGTKIQVSSNS